MKKNKGISLISLVVMIVIMIILAAIAIRVGMESYENALESKAATERQEVIAAVSGRFGDYQRNSTANPIVGFIVPDEYLENKDIIANYIINKLKVEYGKFFTDDEIKNSTQQKLIYKFIEDNYDDMEYTRILSYSDLIDLEIENTNINAVYVVNYYSNDVVGPIN